VDPKDIKCHFQWWGKHEAMFPIVGFLVHQILGIIGSQIETKKYIYSGHIYKLREMLFTMKKNLEYFIFVSKNWLSDIKYGCKFPSNLVELIFKN
jgi:hypothetical protein